MKITRQSRRTRRPFRLLLLAFIGAATICLALLFMDTHVAEAAPTCTINWTGNGGSTSWFTAANWDENRLPTTTDNVCIPATTPATTVAYDQDQSTQILNLQSQQALAVSTGELTLTDTSQTSNIGGALTWSGGSLGGDGNVVVAGPVAWSGGTKTGTGTLRANGGMTISGTGGKAIAGGTVDNPAGQTAVINGTGTIVMSGGGTFSTEGTVDDQVDVAFSAPGFGIFCQAYTGTFNNGGIFIKSGGAGLTSFTSSCGGGSVAFNNSGTVNVNVGTVGLQTGGSSTGGSFSLAGGSTLDFGGGTYTLDGSSHLTGAGTARFTGATVSFASGAVYTPSDTAVTAGTVTFNSPASTGTYTQSGGDLGIATGTLSIGGALTWSGGSLGGDGNVVVAGPVAWSGGTKTGTGTLRANGGMTISGTGGKAIAGGTVDNPAGQTAVINGTGTIVMSGGGTFSTEGTVDDQVDVAFSAPGFGIFCQAYTGTFNNGGIFIKSGGAGLTSFTSSCGGGSVAFNNSGTVNVNVGTVGLQTGGSSTGGSFSLAGGSTLDFGGGTYTLDGSSHLTGAGTARFTGATVSFASGAVYTPSDTAVTAGTVTFNSPASTGTYTQSGGDLGIATGTLSIGGALTWSGGSLGGDGNVVVAGPVAWSGGTKTGTGTLRANGGMTISGTGGKAIAGGTVDNPAGQTAVINGTGTIVMSGGGTFSTEGTVDDQVDVAFSAPGFGIFCQAYTGTFNNGGIFIKSGGAGLTSFTSSCGGGSVAFNNSGTVNVNVGTVGLQTGGSSTGGSFSLAGGSTLDFGGGTYTLDGSSHLTGAGTARFTGATVSFASGAVYTPSDTAVTAGTVTFNSPASTGTYTQSGGDLGVNLGGSASCSTFGQVNVTGAATLGGTLSVGLASGCSPTLTQSFQVMRFASRDGTFASVSTPTVGGRAMPVSYFPTNVTVGSSLDHLVLSPASATVSSGATQAFTATGYDAAGNSLGDVTPQTSFAIVPNGAGTGASCAANRCGASLAGTYTVTGTAAGATGQASLAVTAGLLDHLGLSPASSTITAGGSQAYTATGLDAAGNSLGDVTAQTSFAITPDGSCTANACTATVPGPHTVTGTDAGRSGTATLTVAAPSISIDKTTNGSDGSSIPVGTPITWTYQVTNTGNVALTNVTVTDNRLAPTTIHCGGGSNVIASLAVGASRECTATGTASAGHYTNTGTATGTPPVGDPVSASDASDYYSAPRLIVIKHVVNDNGGTKTAGDFMISVTGQSPSPAIFPGTESPGATVTLQAGSYAVAESGPSGYTQALSADCAGTIAAGQTRTCTVTNDDIPPTLIVIKHVVNDNGGTKAAADFTMIVTGQSPSPASFPGRESPGTTVAVNAGSYAVTESGLVGYTQTSAVGCSDTIAVGQTKTCTIINDDQPGTITVRKITKPANTGSFAFTTTGSGYTGFTLPGGGQNSQTLNAGTYTVREGTQLGWILTGIGGSTDPTTPYACTVTGGGGSTGVGDLTTQTATVALHNGDTVTCVFENTGQGVTRTQGFWATHPALANAAWFGGTAFGHTFPGVTGTTGIGNTTLCGRSIDTPGKVMGGFWSGVSTTSTGAKRTALDQARMQLLQQLLAAELNASAFGSVPSGGTGQFAVWEAAYCGQNTTAIKNAQTRAAAFNATGDSAQFTPGTSADSKTAKTSANLTFWDTLP